jgi:hypothetical protein
MMSTRSLNLCLLSAQGDCPNVTFVRTLRVLIYNIPTGRWNMLNSQSTGSAMYRDLGEVKSAGRQPAVNFVTAGNSAVETHSAMHVHRHVCIKSIDPKNSDPTTPGTARLPEPL